MNRRNSLIDRIVNKYRRAVGNRYIEQQVFFGCNQSVVAIVTSRRLNVQNSIAMHLMSRGCLRCVETKDGEKTAAIFCHDLRIIGGTDPQIERGISAFTHSSMPGTLARHNIREMGQQCGRLESNV